AQSCPTGIRDAFAYVNRDGFACRSPRQSADLAISHMAMTAEVPERSSPERSEASGRWQSANVEIRRKDMERDRAPNGVEPERSEDDIQREQLGPRGVPGAPDPAKMTPQREKKTPKHIDPGHVS